MMAINFSLSKLPWYGQIGVFVVLAGGAVGGFWNYYARPAQAEIDTRTATLTQVRGEINRGLTTARRLPEFRKEVATLEMQLERLRAVLPEERDVADLLNRINSMATQSNLKILGFIPADPHEEGACYCEWPIGLRLEGSYHDMGTFLERISKFPRVINVGDMRLRARESPDDADDSDRRRHRDDVRSRRAAEAGGSGRRAASRRGMMRFALSIFAVTLLAATAVSGQAPASRVGCGPPGHRDHSVEPCAGARTARLRLRPIRSP